MQLGADEPAGGERSIPARMINEFAYCPRLFFLEWVQGEFVDNAFTVEGRAVHERVDSKGGAMPAEVTEPFTVRSVTLRSEKLEVSAKIDLVEGEDGRVWPVDYKRGRPPEGDLRSHEPERVQLCLYGLLLREHGYRCDAGYLYFAAARQRVEIAFDEVLIARTLELVAQAKETASKGVIPPPLRASPKCQGCSLAPVCLPDEMNLLASATDDSAPRQILPARDDAKPLYIQEQGARVGLDAEVLTVRGREREMLAESRLFETSQVVLIGNVQVSSQAVRELCERDIPVCWMTYGGWLVGLTDGIGHGNVELRRAQFRAAEDRERSLSLAKRFVRNKIYNSRTLLRRNHPEPPERALRELASLAAEATAAQSSAHLLGVEGNAARLYFAELPALVRPPGGGVEFDFKVRTRRPPKDPVNALLSLAYSLLAKDLAVTVRAVGLDPFLGFYHQPRHGRPALALDLMEEFRSIIADSAVLTAINTGVVTATDFVKSSLGVALKNEARRRFLRTYERRMQEEITHPTFGYRVSYRRVLEVQVRLLARYLMGELKEYPEFRTR